MAGPPLCERHVYEVAIWFGQATRPKPQSAPRPNMDKRKAAQAAQSQVYYAQIGDCIKIGYTCNLKQRLGELRLKPEAILAAEPGGRAKETERHHQFREERAGRRTEDFNPSRRLLAHVEAIRAEHGEPKMTTYIKHADWHD